MRPTLVKPTLQVSYQQLTKKQKGILIEQILQNDEFTKSKEWLRKYINGAYQKLDQDIENIGLTAIQHLGMEVGFSDVHMEKKETPAIEIGLDNEREKQIALLNEDIVLPIIQVVAPKNIELKSRVPIFKEMLWDVFQKGIASNSLSELGVLWHNFGLECRRKSLQNINPFCAMTELLTEYKDICEDYYDVEELQMLYNHNLTKDASSTYFSWLEFGQKARFTYKVNPFNIIQHIILTAQSIK